tara:strand:- start:887 stop:1759 length:873 start_codon:yes stop_codon:yes gene_type:complete
MENTHEHLNDVVMNQESDLDASEEVEQSLEEAREPEKSDDFSRKFAALSRREKEIRAKEAEYDKRIAELEERLGSFGKKPEPEPELPIEYRLKKDPLRALEDIGLSYDKLTELALNDGKLTPEMQMRLMREELEGGYKKKFEELENRLLEKERSDEQRRYDDIQRGFQNEIEDFVESNPDRYELIQANEANDIIYDVIEEHYNDTGRILDIEEAAEAVESYLEEEAEKLLSLGKLRSKFGIENDFEQEESPRQSQVTLSNAMSAQANERVAKKLSDEESKALAAKMLKWE